MAADPRVPGLRALLGEREPVDRREAASIRRTLVELDRLERPFDEHADPVHVTASAVVVGPRGTLLHRHRRLGLWLQVGGHVDDGEPLPVAALREAEEETGLALAHADPARVVSVDVHPGPRGHTHLDVRYLLLAGDEDPRPAPQESQDVRWFAWDEALGLADAGLAGALAVLREEFSR